jgi:hypothetical protein
MRQLARPKVNKETGEGGPGNGELCNCPADASDPKHPKNEEEIVPETPQQVEGQPSSPSPDVAVNRCYLMDLSVAKVNIPVADVDPSIRISLKSKALLKQMVLGVVDSDSQKCPFFFWHQRTSQRRCLSGSFAAACGPFGPEEVSDSNYVFQQDSALAHTT